MSARKRPDFRVLAKRDADSEDSPLISIGAAWYSETKKDGSSYIYVAVDSLPVGKWNGILQLHPTKE